MRSRPSAIELRDQLRVVDHLPPAAELRVLVLQRVERVRVAGDDADDAEAVQLRHEVVRQLLEQHLVAGAAHAFAGRRLGRAQNAEPDARLLQDRGEGPRDLLAARVEGCGGADVEQVVEVLDVVRGLDAGHAEILRPVAAGVGRESPRIALRLVGLEHGLQLVRERAFHQHALLAHPVELRQVLELDRARRLAIAAGRARPQRVLADHVGNERRQRVRVGRARR